MRRSLYKGKSVRFSVISYCGGRLEEFINTADQPTHRWEQRSGEEGIGKFKPLRLDFGGCWDRRIVAEHRIICKGDGDQTCIADCY